jgi:F-type H+-transporting ATPase subunit delta
MKSQVLVKRYCQGLLGALRTEEEYAAILADLRSLSTLMTEHKQLGNVLLTPFVPPSRKQKIAAEIMGRLSLQPKTQRFFSLLLEKERLELLPDIIALLPNLWNEAHGVATLEVFSVVPLTPTQKTALQEKLEKIEQRPVVLKYQQDPSLIGGLSLRKGNMVYDVSLEGSLERLKEHIIEG